MLYDRICLLVSVVELTNNEKSVTAMTEFNSKLKILF